MRIQTKRIYEPAVRTDGTRILVDRLWPRGISKANAHVDYWAKDIAPSTELRRWYSHEEPKWPEFRRRYFRELNANKVAITELRANMGKGVVTFLFSSKEERLNNATALTEYLRK